MSKKHKLDDQGLSKLYILSRPTPVSAIDDLEIDDGGDSRWLAKSRQFQARRWRELRHHTA